ncbi:hypothetical protein MHYP_G00119620 [Metynnis hypsauchen]
MLQLPTPPRVCGDRGAGAAWEEVPQRSLENVYRSSGFNRHGVKQKIMMSCCESPPAPSVNLPTQLKSTSANMMKMKVEMERCSLRHSFIERCG